MGLDETNAAVTESHREMPQAMTESVYMDIEINVRSRNLGDITCDPALSGWEVSHEQMMKFRMDLIHPHVLALALEPRKSSYRTIFDRTVREAQNQAVSWRSEVMSRPENVFILAVQTGGIYGEIKEIGKPPMFLIVPVETAMLAKDIGTIEKRYAPKIGDSESRAALNADMLRALKIIKTGIDPATGRPVAWER